MVLMQRNLEELHRYVDLAEDLGVECIAARHLLCVAGLGMEAESLARDRERADFHFRRFFERVSRSHSVTISTFPDFFQETSPAADTSAVAALSHDLTTGAQVRCDATPGVEEHKTDASGSSGGVVAPPGTSPAPADFLSADEADVDGTTTLVADPPNSAAPFGSFDVPVVSEPLVGDSVVLAGWALDAVEVEEVTIERAAFASDLASDLNCRGLVHLGRAAFVEGVRPDVAAVYTGTAGADRAGWWYNLEREAISSQPWVDVTVYAVARNLHGVSVQLGQRTISFGSVPFGSFDQPAEFASTVNNAVQLDGWALDRTRVSRVTIEREPLPHDDVAALNERGLVEVGSAKILNGARPDVARAFPWCSDKSRAGWLFELRHALISDDVPCDAVVWAVAHNAAGSWSRIGRRNITFAQGEAARPYIFCSRPFDSVMVDSSGNVSPYPDCRVLAPFGSMADEGAKFDQIWFGKQFTELRQRIIDRDPPPMCLTCAHFINRNVDDGEYFKPR